MNEASTLDATIVASLWHGYLSLYGKTATSQVHFFVLISRLNRGIRHLSGLRALRRRVLPSPLSVQPLQPLSACRPTAGPGGGPPPRGNPPRCLAAARIFAHQTVCHRCFGNEGRVGCIRVFANGAFGGGGDTNQPRQMTPKGAPDRSTKQHRRVESSESRAKYRHHRLSRWMEMKAGGERDRDFGLKQG